MDSRRSISLPRYVLVILAGDLLAGMAAAALALLIRFGDRPESVLGISYAILAALLPPAWVVAMWLAGTYQTRVLVSGAEEFRRIGNGGVWMLAAIAFTSFALHAEVSRALVVVSVPLVTVLTLSVRYGFRKMLHRLINSGRSVHRVLVLGGGGELHALLRHMRRAPHVGFHVVGACLPGAAGGSSGAGLPAQLPVVTDLSQLLPAVRHLEADTIAVAGSEALGELGLRQLSWDLEGTGVRLVVAPAITDVAGPRIHVRPVDGLPLVHVDEPLFSGPQRLLKEAFDLVAASVALVLMLPVIVAIGCLIKFSDGGRILFRQERVGLHGERFVLWKFRTMRLGAEDQEASLRGLSDRDGLLFKMRRDPRVTPLGRWLRRFSLDELPQFWNVLMGNMSLVGPRPPLPREVERYDGPVRRRLLVKPGMTGLWQINGRSDLPWEECVRLDLHYVEHWSVWLDIMVLWKTLGAVLRSRGAY